MYNPGVYPKYLPFDGPRSSSRFWQLRCRPEPQGHSPRGLYKAGWVVVEFVLGDRVR